MAYVPASRYSHTRTHTHVQITGSGHSFCTPPCVQIGSPKGPDKQFYSRARTCITTWQITRSPTLSLTFCAQIGNPDGATKPNKKFYDPRVWTRKAEQSLVARMKTAFEDLNCINVLAKV